MPERARAFSLALFLFLASLLIGRVVARNPVPIVSMTSPKRTSTPATAAPTATPTPLPTPTQTPSPLPPTPTIQLSGAVRLSDQNTTVYALPATPLIHPLRLVVAGSDAYVLDTGQLTLVRLSTRPSCQTITPPDSRVGGVVVQELADVALSADKQSLLLLDRAGNVFQYFPADGKWQLERMANMPGADSRQDLISVCTHESEFYLLDTSVGQVWRHSNGHSEIVPAELELTGSVDFAVGEDIFVIAQEGYRGPLRLRKLRGLPLEPDPNFAPPDLKEPSLLFLDQQPGGHLCVIDQGHQRLRLLDRQNGELVREYLFADERTEIWSAYAEAGRLYMAAGDAIYVYPRQPEPVPMPESAATPTVTLSSTPPHEPRVLELLPELALPIEGTMLSDMAFRLPGAPRTYRYGVHEGLDFYWASGHMVTDETPVLSVAEGVIIRVDREYVPPSLEEIEEMLAHALEVYHTPEETLDVLRGRQVWIDHGEGLVSRYCHLSAVADGLEVGQRVEQGQFIGCVGNSGTPASYYAPGTEMHLHLEIRIGDGYLGQYLRPIDVKRWLNRAFGAGT